MSAYAITAPGIYEMHADAYHADPCPEPSLSSGIAHTLITRSPLHAHAAHPRLNPAPVERESAKFDLGSAAHALILEGEDRMVLIPFDNYQKKAAQEMRDAVRAEGNYPILAHKYDDVFRMREAAMRAIADCPDLRAPGVEYLVDGLPERVLAWQEQGAWCRIRPDWLKADYTVRLDYKTTENANPDAWSRTALSTGADLQDAFYNRGVHAVTGISPKSFFLVQETEFPFPCCVMALDPMFQELAEAKAAIAISTWQECLLSGKWLGYPKRTCYLNPPAWALAPMARVDEALELPESIPYAKSGLEGAL